MSDEMEISKYYPGRIFYNPDMITEADARNIGKPGKAIPVTWKDTAQSMLHGLNNAIATGMDTSTATGARMAGMQIPFYVSDYGQNSYITPTSTSFTTKAKRPTNCVNCGAGMHSNQCEYCRTEYL